MIKPNERLYLNRIMRGLQKYFPAGAAVLDAGCGIGGDAEFLSEQGCQVTGVDIECQTEAWKVSAQKGITYVTASAEALPFPDASFDAVWVKDALHHMENPEQALRELVRVTKPRGFVVVVEANRYNPVFYLHLTLFGGHQHFTRRRLRRMLAAADPEYKYYNLESRCLPWSAPWILKCLEWFENMVEHLPGSKFFMTYQIGILKGQGAKAA